MGSIVSSLASGFTKVIADLFGAPIDFLSGKSCGSVCGSTWDLICYIENFCIANLLKLLSVLILLYIVFLFIYILYKVGICHCLGSGTCKMMWGCLSSCFNALEYAVTNMLFKLRHRRRIDEDFRDLEDYVRTSSEDDLTSIGSYRYVPRSMEFRRSWSRERRRLHLESSLRPRSHRIRVGIRRGALYANGSARSRHGRHVKTVHDIRVTKTSQFVHKGNSGRIVRRRR